MFPKLASGLGKGTSGKSIHTMIFKHVPDMYLPVLRMVSKPFAECLKETADGTKTSQHNVLKQLIKANDTKLLAYYVNVLKWDLSFLLDCAFEEACSLETILFVHQYDYGVGQWDLQDLVITHNRKDVFDEIIRKNMYFQVYSLLIDAFNARLLWPFEWYITTNVLITTRDGEFDLLEVLDQGAETFSHDDTCLSFCRSLMKLMLSFDIKHNAKATKSEIWDFLNFIFAKFSTSERDGDYQLWFTFSRWIQEHYKTVEPVVICSDDLCQHLRSLGKRRYLASIDASSCECKNKENHENY